MTLPATNPLIRGPQPAVADVQIPADGAQLKAHLARPKNVTSAPGVVVIHENVGLNPYVRDVADGLASSGYIAVAPDLLSREGGTDSIDDVPSVLGGSGGPGTIPRARHPGDIQAVIRYLKAMPEVTRIGVIGFCFGGAVTWRVATQSADVAAAVPCYGANPPLEEVPNIKAAVYAVYGELDERINVGIEDINKALDAAGIVHDSKVYAGAQHGFTIHDDNRGRYHPEAAKAAWADALAWFDKYLKG